MHPHKDEPLEADCHRPEGQQHKHEGNIVILKDDEDDDKRVVTMRARAAMSGACLYRLSGGGFLLGRWGWARELPDLRAVGALLSRIDGRPS